MWKIFFFILILLKILRCDEKEEINFEYDGMCKSNEDSFCFPYKDSFINEQLKKYDSKQKLKLLNQQITYYSLKQLEVQDSSTSRFGLFQLEDLQQMDPLFKYKKKNIISSYSINHGLFFMRTFDIQIRKFIKTLYIQLNRIPKKQDFYKKRFSINLNLLFHFINLQKSFLRNDLVGIPADEISPIFQFTRYEYKFLANQNQTESQFQTILKQDGINIRREYKLFMQMIGGSLSYEKCCLIFQRDFIQFSDYLTVSHIVQTRGHQYKDHKFILPYLHYVNQKDHIKKNEISYLFYTKKNYIEILNTAEKSFDHEIYFNYGYSDLLQQAFYSGYMPIINENFCIEFEILSTEDSDKYGLPTNSCLNDETILAYQFVGQLMEMSDYQYKECYHLTKAYQLSSDYYKMIKACSHILIDEKQVHLHVWDKVINQIEKLQSEYTNKLKRAELYLKLRQLNNKNQKIAKLLVDLFKFQLRQVLNTFTLYNQVLKSVGIS